MPMDTVCLRVDWAKQEKRRKDPQHIAVKTNLVHYLSLNYILLSQFIKK